MTIAQEARLEGLRVSIETRGVLLSFNGVDFKALVGVFDPITGEMTIGDREREASHIVVIKDDLPDGVTIDSVFTSEDEAFTYRVLSFRNHPIDVAYVLSAETSEVE